MDTGRQFQVSPSSFQVPEPGVEEVALWPVSQSVTLVASNTSAPPSLGAQLSFHLLHKGFLERGKMSLTGHALQK